MNRMTLELWGKYANKAVPAPHSGTLAENMTCWRFHRVFMWAIEDHAPRRAAKTERRDYEIVRMMFNL